MTEFIHYIFSGANVVPTALLLFVVIYWIIVILGFLGTDFLDFDIDLDGDTDIDIDGDAELNDGASADISWINNALYFFNLGRIPLMIWLSFLVFPLWLICINVNGFLGFESFIPGMIVFVPALFASLFIAKFLTWPFVKIFDKINKDSKEKTVIGKIGTVVIAADHKSSGQAEIDYDGSYLRMGIVTKEGISVGKGQKVLFIQNSNRKGIYLVEPYYEID